MSINNDLKERISDYINRNELINLGDTVIVGVSGGADSLCLLFLLKEIGNFNIKVLHIHHGIRGESADRDADYVSEICKKTGIECEILRFNLPEIIKTTHESLEEAGRRVRYEAFALAADRLVSQGVLATRIKIAVAHHQNDQAETILHNMFRGTDIHGLSGMKPRGRLLADKYRVIRPLLGISRREIEDYLKEKQISFMMDETNQETEYTRNKIRHIILPEAEHINSCAVEHVANMAENIGLLEDYLQETLIKEFDSCITRQEGILTLNIDIWKKSHEYIRSELIRKCIKECTGKLKDITRRHMELICDLAKDGHSGRKIELPYELTVEKNYNRLLFYVDFAETSKLALDLKCEITVLKGMKGKSYPKENCTKWFDYGKIVGTACWREKQQGDFIVTGAGSQKIQDFLKKQKVPAFEREKIKVLVIEETSEILWVYGKSISRINERYKISDDTDTVLQASCQGYEG